MARIRDTSYDKSVVYEPSEDSFLLADAVAEEIWSREKRKESNALRRLDDDDENDFDENDDENDEEEEEFVSVEIGVGSGYVLCSHAMRFCEEMKERLQRKQREDDSKKTKKKCRRVWRFIGVDVNEKAVEHAKETMRRHGLRVVGDDVDEEKEDFDEDDSSISSRYSIEIFRGDMLEDDRFYRRRINDEKKKTEEVKEEEREKKPIDVLLFNPPYVVTPSEEIYDPSTKSSSLSSSLTAAWAGGVRGREVVDRILYDIKSWLRPNGGTFLVVAYAQNDIEEMMEILSNQDGMRVERAKWTKADEESLVVLKAVRL